MILCRASFLRTTIAALLIQAQGAYSQPSPPTTAQRQKMAERHKQMAEMHSKMAACLGTDRPFVQCRQEMTEACSNNFGGNCPIGGRGPGRGKGMNKGACWDWMNEVDVDQPAKDTKASR